MKTLLISAGVVALSIALWQVLAPTSSTNLPASTADKSVIASYLVDGTRTHFSESGPPSEVLQIGAATRWLNSDETALNEIRYQADGEGNAQWDINASDGLFYETTNELVLKNGVTVVERSREAVVSTEALRLYMDQKRAVGEHEVVMTGQGSRTTGSSFELDLQTNTATLKGDVVTDYEYFGPYFSMVFAGPALGSVLRPCSRLRS